LLRTIARINAGLVSKIEAMLDLFYLYVAGMAHGCNIGLYIMAQLVQGISIPN
jgi:hypothetical protein